MPIIDSQDYKPSALYRSAHLGTLIPHFSGNIKIKSFSRRRINTPDGDFLDVDIIDKENDRLAVLCHGLEGSSDSNYIHNIAALLNENNFDIAAMNYRGCSGEMNKKLRMYHSGATDDIDLVISSLESNYSSIVLFGYSLGANMVIKYAGESAFTKSPKLKAVVGISAPCDLAACSDVISKPANYIYEKRFLISLMEKVNEKAKLFADEINRNDLKKVKNLRDFDEYFTGPIHGFSGAQEYYELNSSNRFLEGITIPSLIINALNDPFLDASIFPRAQAQESEHLHLVIPRYGGHVGFKGTRNKYSWADLKAKEFINENL